MTKNEKLQRQKGADELRLRLIRKLEREAKEVWPVDEVEALIKHDLATQLRDRIR